MTALDDMTISYPESRENFSANADKVLPLTEEDMEQCQTPEQLLRSAEFAQYLGIFNRVGSRRAFASQDNNRRKVTLEEVQQYPHIASEVHEFLREMEFQGKLSVTGKLQALADQTLEALKKAEEARSQMATVMSQQFSHEKK